MDTTTIELIDDLRANNMQLRTALVRIKTRCTGNDRPQERVALMRMIAVQALKRDVDAIIDRLAKVWKSEDGR